MARGKVGPFGCEHYMQVCTHPLGQVRDIHRGARLTIGLYGRCSCSSGLHTTEEAQWV